MVMQIKLLLFLLQSCLFFGRSLTLVPLSFFVPKPHGNACYAGCLSVEWDQRIGCLRFSLYSSPLPPETPDSHVNSQSLSMRVIVSIIQQSKSYDPLSDRRSAGVDPNWGIIMEIEDCLYRDFQNNQRFCELWSEYVWDEYSLSNS